MKKTAFIVLLFSILVILECAGPSGGLNLLEEAKAGNVIVIGVVIVENINQEFSFQNWDLPLQVVILGQTAEGKINNYTVTTDARGYYCLPNLPEGRYVLKAVILPEPGGMPIKLVNDLASRDSKFYRMRHPERPIEYTASWFPPKADGRIVNLKTVWLGLRTSIISDMEQKSIGDIMMSELSEDLKAMRFYDQGYPHTREAPLTYFKKKFPDSGWWKP